MKLRKAILALILAACMCSGAALAQIRAAAWGGNLLVEVPGSSLMAIQAQPDGKFAATEEIRYCGGKALEAIAQLLRGEEYAAFMEAYCAGEASAQACRPAVSSAEPGSDLELNSCRLGETWYIVLRPKTAPGERWEALVCTEEARMRGNGTELSVTPFLRQGGKEVTLAPESLDGNTPVFSGKYGSVRLEVYSALDVNLAVLTRSGAGEMQDVRLMIGECAGDGIALNGYADDENAVFCCALADSELEMLRRGCVLELV